MEDLFTHASKHQTPEGIPPDVCVLFEKLALQVAKAGHARYSADGILHQIRWHHHVERGNRDYQVNDHWSAILARWFLARHPDFAASKFFELRVRRSQEAA